MASFQKVKLLNINLKYHRLIALLNCRTASTASAADLPPCGLLTQTLISHIIRTCKAGLVWR